jgi:hypothetical protein
MVAIDLNSFRNKLKANKKKRKQWLKLIEFANYKRKNYCKVKYRNMKGAKCQKA